MELPAPESEERELLLAWLQALRNSVLRKAEGLDEDQARWRRKLISVAGILNHAHVEWRWIDGALRGEPVSRSEDEFVVPVTRPFGQVVEDFASGLPEPTRSYVGRTFCTLVIARGIPGST